MGRRGDTCRTLEKPSTFSSRPQTIWAAGEAGGHDRHDDDDDDHRQLRRKSKPMCATDRLPVRVPFDPFAEDLLSRLLPAVFSRVAVYLLQRAMTGDRHDFMRRKVFLD